MATKVVLNSNKSSSTSTSSTATGNNNMTSNSDRAFVIDSSNNTIKSTSKNSGNNNPSHKRSKSYGGMNVYPIDQMAYHTSQELKDKMEMDVIYASDIVEDNEHKFISGELLSQIRKVINNFMAESLYDKNHDGIIDLAEVANVAKKVDWSNIINRPNLDITTINKLVSDDHNHENLNALNFISYDPRTKKPLWDGKEWESNETTVKETDIKEKHLRNIFICEGTPIEPNIGDVWIKINPVNNIISSINIAKNQIGTDWYTLNFNDVISSIHNKIIETITNNLLIVDHDQLNNLKGGQDNEYYHLTKKEYITLKEIIQKYNNDELVIDDNPINPPIDEDEYDGGNSGESIIIPQEIEGSAFDETTENKNGGSAFDYNYEHENAYDGGDSGYIKSVTFPDNDADAFNNSNEEERNGGSALDTTYEDEDIYDGGNAGGMPVEKIDGNAADNGNEEKDGGSALDTTYENEDIYDGGSANADGDSLTSEQNGGAYDNTNDKFNGGGAFNEENDIESLENEEYGANINEDDFEDGDEE